MGLSKKHFKPRLLGFYAVAGLALWYATPSGWSILAGLLPVVIGEGVRLWATGHLHKNDALTVSGVYAYVRHPLYLGTLLIALGFFWMANNVLALVILAFFLLFFFGYYLPYKDRIEGARLESLYGDEFRRYAIAVPRLLPRLRGYVPLGGGDPDRQHWRGVRFADNNELGTAVVVGFGVVAMVIRWQLS